MSQALTATEHSWSLMAGRISYHASNSAFSVLCCFAISPRVAAQQAAPSRVERKDFYVPTGDGIRLFLREVLTSEKKQSTPILLIHGARVPEIALFEGNFRLCGPEVLPPNGKSTLGPRSSYKRALGGSRP